MVNTDGDKGCIGGILKDSEKWANGSPEPSEVVPNEILKILGGIIDSNAIISSRMSLINSFMLGHDGQAVDVCGGKDKAQGAGYFDAVIYKLNMIVEQCMNMANMTQYACNNLGVNA